MALAVHRKEKEEADLCGAWRTAVRHIDNSQLLAGSGDGWYSSHVYLQPPKEPLTLRTLTES
ncbi:hypothetical protein RUM43_010428 [Polyplax serrata]|uniref:Uncharacterized protein n=1 Tax=Polyplax serrata TaxID=468196 RepID=A0AAN8PLE0_POLSC